MGPLRREPLLLVLCHSPRVSSCSVFSRPLTRGHGNIDRNVRSDWQDKEHSPSHLHKRIWDTLRGEQWQIWAWLDHWWADDWQKSTSSLHKPDYLCMAKEQRGAGGIATVGGGDGGWLAGSLPSWRVLRKEGKRHTRGPGYGARTSLIHWGPFNKSIQATVSPHTCGPTGGWLKGGNVGGLSHGGNHCSIPDYAIKTTEEQRKPEAFIVSEMLAEKSSGTGTSSSNPFSLTGIRAHQRTCITMSKYQWGLSSYWEFKGLIWL